MNVNIPRKSRRNTLHRARRRGTGCSGHTESENGSRSALFSFEGPEEIGQRADEICVPSACRPGSSSDCDARMPWMVPSGASKAPAASRATSEQLARPARLLLATLRPLWPPGWTAPGLSLGAQRVGAACCTVAASELCVMVVRRVWQLIAGRHRYRARARLWCNGDRSVVR